MTPRRGRVVRTARAVPLALRLDGQRGVVGCGNSPAHLFRAVRARRRCHICYTCKITSHRHVRDADDRGNRPRRHASRGQFAHDGPPDLDAEPLQRAIEP